MKTRLPSLPTFTNSIHTFMRVNNLQILNCTLFRIFNIYQRLKTKFSFHLNFFLAKIAHFDFQPANNLALTSHGITKTQPRIHPQNQAIGDPHVILTNNISLNYNSGFGSETSKSLFFNFIETKFYFSDKKKILQTFIIPFQNLKIYVLQSFHPKFDCCFLCRGQPQNDPSWC